MAQDSLIRAVWQAAAAALCAGSADILHAATATSVPAGELSARLQKLGALLHQDDSITSPDVAQHIQSRMERLSAAVVLHESWAALAQQQQRGQWPSAAATASVLRSASAMLYDLAMARQAQGIDVSSDMESDVSSVSSGTFPELDLPAAQSKSSAATGAVFSGLLKAWRGIVHVPTARSEEVHAGPPSIAAAPSYSAASDLPSSVHILPTAYSNDDIAAGVAIASVRQPLKLASTTVGPPGGAAAVAAGPPSASASAVLQQHSAAAILWGAWLLDPSAAYELLYAAVASLLHACQAALNKGLCIKLQTSGRFKLLVAAAPDGDISRLEAAAASCCTVVSWLESELLQPVDDAAVQAWAAAAAHAASAAGHTDTHASAAAQHASTFVQQAYTAFQAWAQPLALSAAWLGRMPAALPAPAAGTAPTPDQTTAQAAVEYMPSPGLATILQQLAASAVPAAPSASALSTWKRALGSAVQCEQTLCDRGVLCLALPPAAHLQAGILPHAPPLRQLSSVPPAAALAVSSVPGSTPSPRSTQQAQSVSLVPELALKLGAQLRGAISGVSAGSAADETDSPPSNAALATAWKQWHAELLQRCAPHADVLGRWLADPQRAWAGVWSGQLLAPLAAAQGQLDATASSTVDTADLLQDIPALATLCGTDTAVHASWLEGAQPSVKVQADAVQAVLQASQQLSDAWAFGPRGPAVASFLPACRVSSLAASGIRAAHACAAQAVAVYKEHSAATAAADLWLAGRAALLMAFAPSDAALRSSDAMDAKAALLAHNDTCALGHIAATVAIPYKEGFPPPLNLAASALDISAMLQDAAPEFLATTMRATHARLAKQIQPTTVAAVLAGKADAQALQAPLQACIKEIGTTAAAWRGLGPAGLELRMLAGAAGYVAEVLVQGVASAGAASASPAALIAVCAAADDVLALERDLTSHLTAAAEAAQADATAAGRGDAPSPAAAARAAFAGSSFAAVNASWRRLLAVREVLNGDTDVVAAGVPAGRYGGLRAGELRSAVVRVFAAGPRRARVLDALVHAM